MQAAGPFIPVVLLIGALGAPAPLGLREKASVPAGIPNPALGVEPRQHPATGRRGREWGPWHRFSCDGLPVLFPPCPHQGRRVPG